MGDSFGGWGFVPRVTVVWAVRDCNPSGRDWSFGVSAAARYARAMEPRTDPRANDPIPLSVLAAAAHELRGEAHRAAAVCERLAREGRDPEVRELARAMQGVCFRAANLGTASRGPLQPAGSWWRRMLRALADG